MKLTLAGRRLLRTNSDHDECVDMRVYRWFGEKRKKGGAEGRNDDMNVGQGIALLDLATVDDPQSQLNPFSGCRVTFPPSD
jgi:hypothetical protein